MANYKDRIGQLPKDWGVVKANLHLVLESGMRPSEFVTDNPSDIPSLGGENIDLNGNIVFDNIRYISKGYYSRMPKGKIHDEDILINKDGANTGKIAFAKLKPFVDCAVNEHIFIIRNKGEFDQEYLFYFLFSEKGNKQIQRKIVGSAQGGINNLFTKGLFIPQPPKPEQKTIATILSKVDEAIQATQNSVKAAEKLKKCLMQNLLTGKLKPDGSLRRKDDFIMTKIGLLPKEWKIKTVKEISTQVTDGEHTTPIRTDKGYYLLSARNIKNGYLDLSDVDYIDEKELKRIQKRCNPKPGDVLLSCSGTIGNVCLVPEGLEAGMVRSAALVKLNKEELEPEFAELVFQSFSLQNQMKISVSSSVQGNIFQDAIKKLRIPYPPSKAERDAITNQIKRISDSIVCKLDKIEKLKQLKKSFMQNLLTGKVRVDAEKINKLFKEQENE